MRGSMIAFMLCLLSGGGLAFAANQDIYVADETPYNPYWSPGAKMWFWPTGWNSVPRDQQGTPSLSKELQPGQSFWLGLENVENLQEIKTVTLRYGGQPISVTGATCGYTDGTTSPWNLVLGEDTGSIREYTATIQPQPGWEWVKLTNNADHVVGFNLIKFSSVCTPEPASLGLLLLGTCFAVRRRR